eukprot:TRINITY_DN14889_c0_g1_i4.p1 TRINITY_DN14889_c0_g1~~TRINITY_DN14889_c0_g1_i4.p1  ORF type:complete len:733 (-),score=185.40 TRINITY_DN14889_c0_g1_i4:130-2328(-)
MHSTALIPHLLLITVTSSIHIPFYCKIRKTNCELRPESACCQHLSSTTTSTTTAATINTSSAATGERVTTLASMDSTEMTKGEENENIQSAPYEEVFEAEPSEIDEVFLKVSGENIEANLITTSTGKPEKYAPRFCLKLKFNCKLRKSHACCKYPLPPRDENPALPSPTAFPKPVKLQVRPTRIQITPVSDTEGKSNKRKSPFRRPLRNQQNKIDKENEVGTVEDNDANEANASTEPKRKPNLRNNAQRPAYNPVRKSPSLTKRRRPAYSSSNKSPVCRIINCKRNKKHKCCQKPTESTTTPKSTTTSTTVQKETTKGVDMYIENELEKNQSEEVSDIAEVVTQKQITSSIKPTPIEITNPEQLYNDPMTEYPNLDNIDAIEKVYVTTNKEKIINKKEYEDLNVDKLTTEQSANMVYETTTVLMEYFPTENVQNEEEIHDQSLVTIPVYIENMEYEQKAKDNLFEGVQNSQLQNSTQTNTNTEQAMYNQNKENKTLTINQDETAVKEQAKLTEIVTEKIVKTEANYKEVVREKAKLTEIVTETIVKTEANYKEVVREKIKLIEIVTENIKKTEDQPESLELAKNSQSEILEQSYIFQPVLIEEEYILEEDATPDYPAYEIDYPEYIIYEDTEPVERKVEHILSPILAIPIPDNHIDQEALDPNQILPRVAVECFRFHCISEPQHDCCTPHTANKRQTGSASQPKHDLMEHLLEDHPGRVTATVTRVQKTVRW